MSSAIPRAWCFALLAAALPGLAAVADLRPHTFHSDNRRFVLTLEPGRSAQERKGCRAVLSDAERPERPVWERPLVNDDLPAHVCVHDEGRFVITLDERRSGGARHALVIYDQRGELRRHFLLTDLLDRDDWEHVRVRRKHLDWLSGAQFRFVESPAEFRIALAWGRGVRIDLRTFRVVRNQAADAPLEQGDLPPVIQAALSEEPMPAAEDASSDRGADLLPSDVRLSLAEALALAELFGWSELHSLLEALDTHGAAVSEMTWGEWAELQQRLERGERVLLTSPEDEAGAPQQKASPHHGLDERGLPPWPPPPTPWEPVDYFAWINQFGHVDPAQDAAPFIQTTVSAFDFLEGDAELLNLALSGQPEILASAEVQDLLSRNRAALEAFRAAANQPGRSWHFESPDGDLLNVRLDYLRPFRQTARLVVLEGKLLEADGQLASAAAAYLDVAAAARHCLEAPTLLENLVGASFQAMASEALLDLIARPDSPSVTFVDLAERAARSIPAGLQIDKALRFEQAAIFNALQLHAQLDSTSGEWRLNTDALSSMLSQYKDTPSDTAPTQLDTSFDAAVELAMRYGSRIASAGRLPFPEAHAELLKIESQIPQHAQAGIVSASLIPAFSRASSLSARGATTARAAGLVVQIKAFEQRYGRLPGSLDELPSGDFQIDPFTGRPFVYRPVQGGFLLYSLGLNGQDDGGRHGAKSEEGDLVYWPRPARPGV